VKIRKRVQSSKPKSDSSATIGYESQLWQMADALRGSMDAAEYKHVVLGLIFLKYISDAFEEQQAKLVFEKSREPTPKIPTNTAPRTSFGSLPKPAGRI
jgi:type I restriction enzyme M protein